MAGTAGVSTDFVLQRALPGAKVDVNGSGGHVAPNPSPNRTDPQEDVMTTQPHHSTPASAEQLQHDWDNNPRWPADPP